jgi:hypothetical protein
MFNSFLGSKVSLSIGAPISDEAKAVNGKDLNGMVLEITGTLVQPNHFATLETPLATTDVAFAKGPMTGILDSAPPTAATLEAISETGLFPYSSEIDEVGGPRDFAATEGTGVLCRANSVVGAITFTFSAQQ